MKKYSVSLLAALMALNVASAPRAYAQDRVINEEIVVQDPTVAESNKWAAGGSFEGWYVTGPYNGYDSGGNLVSTGYINGGMWGGNGFIGYGPVTAQFSHREGVFKVTQTYTNTAQVNDKETQGENEFTVRWLFKVARHFNPYALIGYNATEVAENDVIQNNFVWNYNNSKIYNAGTTYSSPLFGGGAIVPFNKYVGARGDVRVLITSGKWRRDDGLTSSGSGAGAAVTLTAYGNIYKGLNIQTGFKYQGLNAGKNVPSANRIGIWGSLGYSYKF